MWKRILNLVTGGIGGTLLDAGLKIFKGIKERGERADALNAKIKLAKVNKDAKLELADHEIQVLRTKDAGQSWKDEYVTLLVSVPIIVAMAGALIAAFEPDVGNRLLTAAKQITGIMTGQTIDFAELWLIVVATALGTKPFRK